MTPLPAGVDAQSQWTNVLCGAPDSNSTEYCLDSLFANENLRFFQAGNEYRLLGATRRTYGSCLYTTASYVSMSSLDALILSAAFFLLTIAVGGDVRSQNRTSCIPICGTNP